MKIKSINIKDFLSIKDLSYTFEDGLHLFVGDNGAGKSSILTALQVGLYNKCDRPNPLARLSGPGGFKIEVEFVSVSGSNVKVINNRTKNRYEVYEDGELLTHQISKGIPIVSKMLNLSYHEFQLLTFLTPTTVANILTNTDSSLISKFFSLDVLSEYDKSLREDRRDLTKDKKRLESNLADSIQEVKVYDIEALDLKASGLRMRKLTAMSSQVIKEDLPKLQADALKYSTLITKLSTEHDDALVLLHNLGGTNSKCELCGHDLEEDTTAKLRTTIKLTNTIDRSSGELVEAKDSYHSTIRMIDAITTPYEAELSGIEAELLQVDAELIAASIITKKDTLDTESVLSEITSIEHKIILLNMAVTAIKEGSVHKAYLDTFTSILNTKLGIFKEELKLDMRVIAKISSTGLSFTILDDGVFKSADVLSAGEKVIVGLLVLSAMFDTLEDTLDIHISTIMLDEAVSAVSTENMHVVERVIRTMSKTRCVIVTQHHEELPKEIFDTVTQIIKMDGLTSLREL